MAAKNQDKNALIAKLQEDVKKAVEAKYAHAEKVAKLQGKQSPKANVGFYIKIPYLKIPYLKIPYIKLF